MRRLALCMVLFGIIGCSKGAGGRDSTKDTADRDSQTVDSTTAIRDSATATDTTNGSTESGETDPVTDDSESASNSSDSSSVSPDSATGDTDTLSNVQYGEPEIVYDFPGLEGEGGGMYNLDVDDTYIYFSTASSLYRVDKDGGSEATVNLHAFPTGGLHQNLTVDGDAVFWLFNTTVVKLDKATDEKISLSFAEEGEEMDMEVLILDDDRIYLAGQGCVKMVSISKDGGDRIVSERPIDGDVGPITTLALDADYVYCGGGSRGPNMGKLFRCPKEGGEITEVTTLPEATDKNLSHGGPQVTGMVVVNDQIYFVSNYYIGAEMQYFSCAPASGGEYTRIAELKGTSSTDKLFYDEKRNSLFFLAQGKTGLRGVYKYDLTASSLSYLAVTESLEMPMAADEDYVYWHTRSQIYRMKKF